MGTGFLEFSNFKEIINSNSWLSHVELSNWGEIFLNPDFLQILKYSYKKNVTLTADNGVNLNTITEDAVEALVKYKFRSIKCSIDGASQATYSLYRRNGNLEKVISNIEKINEYKRKFKSAYPVLKWQFIAFGHNEHEIHLAKALAKKLNMDFWIKLSWDELYSPIKNKDFVAKEAGLGVSSRSEYYHEYKVSYRQRRICTQLWRIPQINWDGRVLGCCVNYWQDFGNAFEIGLLEALNSEKISYARKMLLGEVNQRSDIPCTNCEHYKTMSNHKNWLKTQDIVAYGKPMTRAEVSLTNKVRMISRLYFKMGKIF